MDMTKGHIFTKIDEIDDLITWKCEKCNKEICFSKVYEPKTTGELPENAGDYVDKCEVD